MFKTSTAHACNIRAKRAQLLLLVATRSRPLNLAHRVLQVEGCVPKFLKKGEP